jgi:hypothetical protein
MIPDNDRVPYAISSAKKKQDKKAAGSNARGDLF